jgi:GT2 family glycosyltransferase
MAHDGERSRGSRPDGAAGDPAVSAASELVGLDDPEPEPESTASPPAVVAVAVSTGGAGLEAVVADLTAQRYGALTVLVVDAAADEGVAARVAAVSPTALVLRAPPDERPAGGPAGAFATAADAVLGAVEGAPFLLFVADDLRLADDVVRQLVEEAYRSNAGVLGPKILALVGGASERAEQDEGRDGGDEREPGEQRPDQLVDVGFAIDHYGVRYDPIEPGELDQEQHDAVRDVFGVSSRLLLVRADLFEALDGFDAACGPAADVDFCWRAHLAGARVVVVPDAVARGEPAAPADARAATYGRVRALAKSYSGLALVWTVPIAFLLTASESVVRLVQRRPRHARALLLGWLDALRDFPAIRAERRATQALRHADDRDVRVFMVRGSARLRVFVTRRLHADERLATASLRTRSAFDEASGVLHREQSIALVGLVALLVLGARGLLTGPPTVRGFASWSGVSVLWHAYTSFHRQALLGAAAPAPALLAIAAAASTLLLGHADLARAFTITAAIPVGVYGAYRLVRELARQASSTTASATPPSFVRSAWPPVVAAVAYAVNPLSRNAAAHTDLGALLTFAVAPYVMLLLVGGPTDSRVRWRRTAGAAIVTAVAASAAPVAVLLPALIGAAVFGARLLVPPDARAGAVLRDGACATAGAFVLLLPWSAAWWTGDAAVLGWSLPPRFDLGELIAFRTGPNGAGWLPYGLLAAAALSLVVASGTRLRHATAGWLLFVVGLAAAFVPGRVDAAAVRPAVDVVLVPAALGLAVAVGAGFSALLAEIRAFVFGTRQLVAIVTAAAIVLPVLSFLGDLADGRFRAPGTTWDSALAFLPADAVDVGPSRVAWIGVPGALPADPVAAHGLSYALTMGADPDARDLLPRSSDASRLVAEAIGVAGAHQTARLGHLLAPLGVRYVVLTPRAAPDAPEPPAASTQPRVDPALARALDEQLDLSARDVDGLRVYTNEAWIPLQSRLPAGRTIPTGAAAAGDPIGAILATDLDGAQPLSATNLTGPILAAETHTERLQAHFASSGTLASQPAFGVTNVFSGEDGVAHISFDTPTWFTLTLVGQLLLWAVVLVAVVRLRGRRNDG